MFSKLNGVLFLAFCVIAGNLCGAADSVLPANTWVRLADCPGDAEGREVPPGRASTWTWCPPLKGFVRYGGYTPRFSNALDLFDPATKKWTRLMGEDENYPEDRPPGVCEALVVWDETRKCVWIAGGLSSANTGVRGIWKFEPAKYDPKKKASEYFTLEAVFDKRCITRLAFDSKNGVFVAAPPPSCDGDAGGTHVYTLVTKKWERNVTKVLPQDTYAGHFRMIYDEATEKIICVACVKKDNKEVETWAYDVSTHTWTELSTQGPIRRGITTLAYDPGVKQIVLFGGSTNGECNEYTKGTIMNDTWYFNTTDKKWAEVKTPGPTLLKVEYSKKLLNEITYRCGLAWDPERKCMSMMDPDLGVWQFKYDPKAEPGKDCISSGFTPAVGAASKNTPAEGPAEIRKKFPTALNPKLVNLPDNTVIKLKGHLIGDEIAWAYDKDTGLFAKYGGCGNNSSPYWSHYGNDLGFYDPGTETGFYRRIGDVSGGARPVNGCTRTPTYDASRKVFWFFGGTASGPYMPSPKMPPGCYTYNVEKDLFTTVSGAANTLAPSAGQNCYMLWSPDHDLAIYPTVKATLSVNFKTATWESKPSPDCPGPMYTYQRLAYVNTKKSYLRIADIPTGKTSAAKPTDALTAELAAGKADNFWIQDSNLKIWKEYTLTTYLYNPTANTWTDMKPAKNPPFRTSKYGLVYDPINDVVILIGGAIYWNGPECKDMWVYDVKKNEWSPLNPQQGPEFKISGENLMADYDCRHNVIVFKSSGTFWAYRYKK